MSTLVPWDPSPARQRTTLNLPERVLNALRDAGPAAAEVGLELGRELLEGSRERAQGAYVVAPFRRPLGILDLLA